MSEAIVRAMYPEAHEDAKGTIWLNKTSADSCAELEKGGKMAPETAFDNALGWSWDDAAANIDFSNKLAARCRWIDEHPKLHRLKLWRGAIAMFFGIVWRDAWEAGPLDIRTAWNLSRGLWL